MFGAPNINNGYLKLDCSNDPLTGTLDAQSILPAAPYAYSLGDVASRWQYLHFARSRSVAENGVTEGVEYTATFEALASGYYIMSGDAGGSGMIAQVGDPGTGGPATAFMGLFSFSNPFLSSTILSEALGDSSFQSGNVGASVCTGATVHHQANGQGCFVAGSCVALVNASPGTAIDFGCTTAAQGGFCAGSANFASFTGVKTLLMQSENSGAVVLGFVTSIANGAHTSSLRSIGAGSYAQAYVARGVGLASGQGASLSGSISATNNTAGITSNGIASFAHAAITSTGSATASNNGAVVFASVTGAANVLASGAGSGAFGQSAAVAITAAFTNSWQFGPGAVPQADCLAVGAAGVGITLKGTAGAFAAPLLGQIYNAGGFTYIYSNGKAVQQNVGQAYTTATFTVDRDISNSATIGTVELGNVLSSLIADLKTAGILN